MNTRIASAGFFLGIALIACAPLFLSAQTTPTTVEQRAALQAELDRIERDIANNQGTLTDLRKQRTTLERDIAILDNKIKTAQLQIKKTDVALSQLKGNITEKQSAIREVDTSVSKSQASLAQLLRRTREVDDIPLAMRALSAGSISDIFEELDAFATIERALDESFTEMARLRTDLSDRKRSLEEKEDEAQKVRQIQVLAKQAVQNDEKEKQSILSATKGQEKTYQELIADKQKQAAAIRAALFGLRDSGAIPFGTAYEYAKEASAGTGVRAALILAVLRQETNLGENVGQCLLTNSPNDGDGKGKNTGTFISAVMPGPIHYANYLANGRSCKGAKTPCASRDDVTIFKQLTDALGRDWSTTVVSCPQPGGYGGAMGPSQFIPSTWMLYKDRLARLTGETFPNPWNARTAIFATALLMEDNGADGGVRASERKAALKYFAGSNWNLSKNAYYGDRVMELADDIQAQINILEGR